MQGAKSKAAHAAHAFGAERLERAVNGDVHDAGDATEKPPHNENEVFFRPPEMEELGTHAKWADEVVSKFGQELARKAARSRVVQFVVAATVLLDVVISVYTVIDDSVNDEMSLRVISVVILVVLVFDITVRLVAHRMAFFLGGINVLEFVIVILCLLELIVRNLLPINSSIGRLFRPVARGLKITSSTLKVIGVKRRVNMRVDQLADTLTDDLLEKVLGDVIYISPENATAQPTEGRFLIEKTHFLPKAFADLHAPVTIKGGFIELIYVDADLKTPTWKIPFGAKGGGANASSASLGSSAGGGFKRRLTKISRQVTDKLNSRKAENSKKHGSGVVVVCKNILLVVGPGHHEQGHGGGSGGKDVWDYDEVVSQKDRLVELFASRLELLMGKKKKKKESVDNPPTKKPPPAAGVMGFMGQIRDAIFTGAGRFANIKHVSVDILSVEVRYEDFDLLPRPEQQDPGARSTVSFMSTISHSGRAQGPKVPISLGFKVGAFHLRLEGGPTSPLDHPLFRAHPAWHQGAPIINLDEDDGEDEEGKHKSPPKSPSATARGALLHAGHSSDKVGLDSSVEKPPLRLAIRLVRVSSWLDHDVQQSSCFTPLFPAQGQIKLNEAFRLFRRMQCFERLTLAAISAVEQEALKDADESGRARAVTDVSAVTSTTSGVGTQLSTTKKTKLRMQRFREMVMPHYYIMSPTVVSVHMLTLEPPEPEGAAPKKALLGRRSTRDTNTSRAAVIEAPWRTDHRPGHSIDCNMPKLSFQLDPWQIHSLLLLKTYFSSWVKHDQALSRRPILRPGQVPHFLSGDGVSTEWKKEVDHYRSQVIHSWWVYAVHEVAYGISPNGKLETFLELRRRARCRGVYISSLMTKLRSEHLHKMTWSLKHNPHASIFGRSKSVSSSSGTESKKALEKSVEELRSSVGDESRSTGMNKQLTPGSADSADRSPRSGMKPKLMSSATSTDLIRLMDAAEKRPQDFIWNDMTEYALREMQVTLPFQDILMARVVAKQRHEDEKRGGHEEVKQVTADFCSSESSVVQIEEPSVEKPPPKAETSQIALRIGSITTAFLDPPSGDKGVKLRRQQVRAYVRSTSLVFAQGSPASEWPRLTRMPVGVVNRGQRGPPPSDDLLYNALREQPSPPISDANAATSGWIGVELTVGAFGVLYVQAPQEAPSLRVVLQQLMPLKKKEERRTAAAAPSPERMSLEASCASTSLEMAAPQAVSLESTPVPCNPMHVNDCVPDLQAPMMVIRALSWHEEPPANPGVGATLRHRPSQQDLDYTDAAWEDSSGEETPDARPPAPPKAHKNLLLVFVSPLEVFSYKPLVQMLARSFKAPMAVIPADNLDLGGHRRVLQQRRAVRNGIKNLNRGFEKATGFKLGSAADNNTGVRFVISMGSLQATTIEQFTRDRLLIQRVDLPANTEAFSSNEIPPFFDVGMRLQSAKCTVNDLDPHADHCYPARPVEVAAIHVAVEDDSVEVDQFFPSEPVGNTMSLSPRTAKDSPFRWMSTIFASSCAKLPASCAEASCNGSRGTVESRTMSKDEADAGSRTSPSMSNSMTEIPLQVVPVTQVPVTQGTGAPWSLDSKKVNVRIKSAKLLTLERELLRLSQTPGVEPQFLTQEPTKEIPAEPDNYIEC